MTVVFTRVDDRLVHGQVVQGWVPFVGADSICVVNDEIHEDEGRCRLMRMIVPPNLHFQVVPIDDLTSAVEKTENRRIFLLFRSLEDLLKAVNGGTVLKRINLGNLHHQRGGAEVSPSLFLNRNDIRILRRLFSLGIDVEARDVPEGRTYDLQHLIDEGNAAT